MDGGTAPWAIGVAIISINACLLGVAWYFSGSIENGVHDARRFFSSRPSTAAPGSKATHSSASDQPMISHRNGWDPSSQPSHATSPADASKPRSERGDLRCPAGLGSVPSPRDLHASLCNWAGQGHARRRPFGCPQPLFASKDGHRTTAAHWKASADNLDTLAKGLPTLAPLPMEKRRIARCQPGSEEPVTPAVRLPRSGCETEQPEWHGLGHRGKRQHGAVL